MHLLKLENWKNGRLIMDFLSILLILVIFIISILLISVGDKKLRTISIVAIICVLSYICSIRPLDSADTINYLHYYNIGKNLTEFHLGLGRDYNPWVENWFINLCWLCNLIGLSFKQFLFVMAFMINGLSVFSIVSIYKTFYPENNKMYGIINILFLLISQYGILYAYVAIRGGLAFALCLFSFKCFVQKKFFGGALSVVAAISIQNFSWVFLIILFIYELRINKRNNKLLTVLFFLLLVFAIIRVDIVITRLISRTALFANIFSNDAYYNQNDMDYGIKKGILLCLVQNIYLLYLLKDRFNGKINNLFIIILTGSFIDATISSNSTIRIANYFIVFQLLLYSEYLNCHIDSKEGMFHSVIITVVIPILSSIYMMRYCGIV